MSSSRSLGDVMTSDSELEALALAIGDLARLDEPLGEKTTYRVGGRASLFVDIIDEESLARVVSAVRGHSVEVLVIGNGSNLLVADRGFSGLALRLGGSFLDLSIDEHTGIAGAGGALSYPVLARKAAARGLAGLEWAVGIPGTVGGAVVMNAGGHGASTKESLIDARVLDLQSGNDEVISVAELDCSYRHTNISSRQLVLGARFRARPGQSRDAGLLEIDEIVRWRREHQPGGRNCGSVFTNPPGDSAGRIIEAAGLKGLRYQSAEVSTKHANFIQVDANGRADDVRTLIEMVRSRVADESGVELVAELRMVGFSS